MSIMIKAVSEVSEAQSLQLDALCDQAYAGDQTDLTWTDEEDWRVWLEVDGQMVSCLTIVERRAEVAGMPVRLGGIGGVATLPAQQRQGYARQVLDAAAEFLRDSLRVDFGMLVCSPHLVAYYARAGWQPVAAPMLIDQPRGKVTLNLGYMVLPCAGSPWPAGTLDLCGLPW